MNKVLFSLAVLPLLGGLAMAQQATELNSQQMDSVVAGHTFMTVSNTSATTVEFWTRAYLTDPTGNTLSCSSCYLFLVTPTFSVVSQFGP